VAEATRFYHVVAALDASTAERVEDLLVTIPNENPYTILKKRLTEAYTLSDRERAVLLLEADELGDRKPSVFADYILGLAGNRNIGFLLREIFLRGLPEKIRTIIISSDTTDLRVLALEADRHFANSGALIANTSTSELQEGSIQAVKNRRPRQNSRQFFQPNQASSSSLCFFHARFGTNAHKCRQPCSWKNASSGNDLAGHRQ
jgi:hypothetical protein